MRWLRGDNARSVSRLGSLHLLMAIVLIAGCRVHVGGARSDVERALRFSTKRTTLTPSQTPPSQSRAPSESTDTVPASGLLTLDRARRIAVSSNPDVHAAQARLEAARARIAQALAAFLPTISLKHTSTRTLQTPPSRPRLVTAIQNVQQLPTSGTDPLAGISPVLRPLFQPLFGASSFRLQSNANPFSDHSSGFTISWTIYDGFIREAQVQAATQLQHAAERSLADVQRLILRAVDTAYYQVQLAEEQLRIARADEVFSRDQYEDTEKLRAAGRATQADVDNFRVRMLAAQADVTAAIGLRDSGRVALAELMGTPDVVLGGEVTLAPLTEESDRDLAFVDATPWIERAMANRPDLRRLSAIVESERQNVQAVHGLFSPAVGVSGSWGFDRTSNMRYGERDQSSAAGVELRWDLYTGGSRRAKMRAARAVYAEAMARLKRLRLAVTAEVRVASIDLIDAQEQIRLQRENLRTALENRRIIRAAYFAGKETLTRLNEAQRDYIEADAGLALSRIRLRQAWSDLYAAAATYGDATGVGP